MVEGRATRPAGWSSRGATAALLAAAVAGCAPALPDDLRPQPSTPVLPQPLRGIGLASVAALAVAGAWCRDGAPPTRPLGTAALAEGSVTWLGHSGVLLRMAGRSVIVDPALSTRLGLPLSPPRLAAAPDLSALDRLDAVLLSHDDPDHLDLPSLRALARAFPRAVLVVPAGIGDFVSALGFAAVREVAHWRGMDLGPLRITATSALHHGRRDLIGLRRTPAAGWALRGAGLRVFHAGDTAYGPVFERIGAELGPFDLAIVPIGAWAPTGLMGTMHATPEDAMRIAAAVGAAPALGVHWGTFGLGAESPARAAARFRAAAAPGTPVPVLTGIGQTVPIAAEACS